MTQELVTNGKELLFIHRKRTPAIQSLGPRQLQWLEARFPGISRNRVTRLHEKAAYEMRGDENRDPTIERRTV